MSRIPLKSVTDDIKLFRFVIKKVPFHVPFLVISQPSTSTAKLSYLPVQPFPSLPYSFCMHENYNKRIRWPRINYYICPFDHLMTARYYLVANGQSILFEFHHRALYVQIDLDALLTALHAFLLRGRKEADRLPVFEKVGLNKV